MEWLTGASLGAIASLLSLLVERFLPTAIEVAKKRKEAAIKAWDKFYEENFTGRS